MQGRRGELSLGGERFHGLIVDRRRTLTGLFAVGSSMWQAVDRASAACMSGDLSPECIGVYKLPEGAAVSKDVMKQFAPDIKYVEPLKLYLNKYREAARGDKPEKHGGGRPHMEGGVPPS